MINRITKTGLAHRFAANVIRNNFDSDNGRHPLEIFYAMAQTGLWPVAELVITPPTKDAILLTQRPDDDPFYPSAWHLPGVMMTKKDAEDADKKAQNGDQQWDAFDIAALRAKEELEGTRISPLVCLSPNYLPWQPRISKRGGELATFYGAYLIDEEPKVGRMFGMGEIPEIIHEHHPEVILQSVSAIHMGHAQMPLI